MNNNKRKDLSLVSRGLKYKLKVAAALMIGLPLLACLYLILTYVIPATKLKLDIIATTSIFITSVFIASLGFFLIKKVFDRFVSVSIDAKLIASGDLSRKVDIEHPDEVGDLGDALNQLTQRIRTNMEELKSYGERTTAINLEIQKRVLVLSSILQISSLISQGARIEDILRVTTEKSRLLADSDVAYLLFREEGHDDFTVKLSDGINAGYLLKLNIGVKDTLFSKAVASHKPLILDKQNTAPENMVLDFYEKFRLKNTLAIPVQLKGKVSAILGVGNTKDGYLYRKDDIELLDVFAKQVAIAVENDMLIQKIEKLEVKDSLTGLYNQLFIRSRLEEEIKRAIVYHRPCAFVILDLDNFQEYHRIFGSLQAEGVLKKIAVLIKESITDVDRVGRFGDDEFAVILPEKNKRNSMDIAEEIRKKIEFSFSEETDPKKKITVSGGISENPLDGVTSEELVNKAKALLDQAKGRGKNCIAG